MEQEGIVDVPPVFTKSALSVRQNPKVYKALYCYFQDKSIRNRLIRYFFTYEGLCRSFEQRGLVGESRSIWTISTYSWRQVATSESQRAHSIRLLYLNDI